MRLIRSACILAVAVSAAAAGGAAHADTRLFTVRTSQPNVTIVQTLRNGGNLPIAGVNGNDTIFRIDNPSGAVPCANRLEFVTSQGQHIDSSVNLCNSNWDLTVSVNGSGGANPPGPPSSLPQGVQPIAIATDDPNITITQVFLSGQPVEIADREDPYVEVDLAPGANGFQCARDLGLALSDGRRIARNVDVCQSNFVVVIALVGGPAPPPPPPNIAPGGVEPAPPGMPPLPPNRIQPGPPQAPEPPIAGGPTPGDNTQPQWTIKTDGDAAGLLFIASGADTPEFEADCKAGASKASVTLQGTAERLTPGVSIGVSFIAGGYSSNYSGVGGKRSPVDGLSHPIMRISLDDGLWAAMIRESNLGVRIGNQAPYSLELAGSAAAVQQFIAFCRSPGGLQPPPAPIPDNVSIFVCKDGSSLQISFDRNSAAVSEAGVPPVVLLSAPTNVGKRYAAGNADLSVQGPQAVWSDGLSTRYCLRQ